jgi:hypothetical protein
MRDAVGPARRSNHFVTEEDELCTAWLAKQLDEFQFFQSQHESHRIQEL